MIYLFGKGKNVSYIDGKNTKITNGMKNRASLIVGRLPKPEIKEGYTPHLMIDEKTNEIQHYYTKNEND